MATASSSSSATPAPSLTSPAGASLAIWTPKVSGTTASLNSVTYANNQFVIAGNSGTILTSPDAETWTAKNSGTTANLACVTFGDSQFVAVGAGGIVITAKADPTAVLFRPTIASAKINGIKIIVANDNISVAMPSGAAHSQIKAALFNIAGRRIYSTVTRSDYGTLNIPAAGIPTGIYFISITDGSNKTMSSKFVLAR